MNGERIEIEVREDGSREVKRNLEQMAWQAELSAASIDLMKSALNSIQGTVKQPISSLQQMRSAMAALSSASSSPGGIFDPNNTAFATAALDRLRQATAEFAKTAPSNVEAAIGRINLATGGLTSGIDRATAAQRALIAAQQQTKIPPIPPVGPVTPVQQGFGFMDKPIILSGSGWQLEGTFKSVAATAPAASTATTQFATAAKAAGASASQLNLNLGAANQSSFAFMQGMQAQARVINPVAAQYQTIGQVWTKNTQQAHQLSFALNGVTAAAGGGGGGKGGIASIGSAAGGAFPNVNNLTRSLWYLQRALQVIASYLFLREIKEYIDTWTGAHNMIGLYTKNAADAAEVEKRLYEAAQQTHQQYGLMVQLYQRGAQSAGALGASQEQLLQFTKGVGMALVVQNRSATQASGALLQLGQLLGMAKIRMQEFNSISENMPIILQLVAKNIKGAEGSIARLRDMIHKGKVSSADFFAAFLKGMPELEAQFATLRPTITQAFNNLDNALGRFIFQTDQGVGASTAFAIAIIKLAANIDVLVKSVAAIGLGILIGSLPSLIGKMVGLKAIIDSTTGATLQAATGLRGLWATIMAHPFGALAAVVVAAITAIYLFRDSITVVKSEAITLGDVYRGTFQYIADLARGFVDYMSNLWSSDKTTKAIDPILNGMTNLPGMEMWVTEQKKQVGIFEGMLRDMVQSLKDQINMTIGAWVTATTVIPLLWDNMWLLMKNSITEAVNDHIAKIQLLINAFHVLNQLAKKALHPIDTAMGANPGIELSSPVQLPRLDNSDRKKAREVGADIDRAIAEGMGTDYVGREIDKIVGHIRSESTHRKFWEAGGLFRPADLNAATTKLPGSDDGGIDKLQKKLDHLHETVDPVWGALNKITEAEKLIDKAVAAGLPLWETKTTILDQVRRTYEDLIDPVGAYIRKIKEEIEVNKSFGPERRGGLAALKAEIDLKKKLGGAGKVTDAQIEEIRALNEEKRATDELARAKESLYNKTVGHQRALVASQAAVNEALKSGWITLKQAGVEMLNLRINANKATFSETFIAQLINMQMAVRTFAQNSAQILGDFTRGFVDGIAGAVGESIAHWTSFKDAIYNVATSALSSLISAFVKLGLQTMLVSALEDTWLAKYLTGLGIKTAATVASTTATTAVGTAATATAVVEAKAAGAAITAAYAPAATAASVATMGSAAWIGIGALAAAVAIGLGFFMGKGLESGGYTGNGPRNQIAGAFHGQEFVVNADGTRKNRALLEAINAGSRFTSQDPTFTQIPTYSAPPAPVARGNNGERVAVNIRVENMVPGVETSVERTGDNDFRIRTIAREEVERHAPRVFAREIANPNSQVSSAQGRFTRTERRRGA